MVEIYNSLGAESFTQQFADSPKALSFLEAHFGGDENVSARQELFECTDESDFSLRQWVESLRVLQAWLDAKGLTMSITDKIGFVCCAAESAGPAANLSSLPSIVDEMLQTYGCERAVAKS